MLTLLKQTQHSPRCEFSSLRCQAYRYVAVVLHPMKDKNQVMRFEHGLPSPLASKPMFERIRARVIDCSILNAVRVGRPQALSAAHS